MTVYFHKLENLNFSFCIIIIRLNAVNRTETNLVKWLLQLFRFLRVIHIHGDQPAPLTNPRTSREKTTTPIIKTAFLFTPYSYWAVLELLCLCLPEIVRNIRSLAPRFTKQIVNLL